MREYIDIVKHVLTQGNWKENRTGVRTICLPNQIFSHDMKDGFPLLTTKKMPLRVIAVELEGFIKGITDKRWYQDRKCRIWDEWANPRKVKDRLIPLYAAQDSIHEYEEKKWLKDAQKEEADLGPIYGYQWRKFNQVYDEYDDGCTKQYDQLKEIVNTLHKNPDDRRMVCSAWNPIQMDRMALPPCHFAWNLMHCNGVLNLCWMQRSCDLMLGVPFNIASYGLLLSLLCKESGLKPGNLTGVLVDCHIYENHIPAAKEQCKRELEGYRILPNLTIYDKTSLYQESYFDIFEWTHEDILLENYNPHPKLEMEIAI